MTVPDLARARVVLDREPLTLPAEEITQTRVLRTYVSGRYVYQSIKNERPEL